uniref:F-box domain-containing protein n=1 Tax=Syphacia muris TaxID=451379 RepID=A0A0N5AR95_9BILA
MSSEVKPEAQDFVFWNPILMERIISYVPLVKDRINIEKCCRRMRTISKRALYLKADADCSLLDMHFQTRKPEITVAFSGNELVLPVTVSDYRLSNDNGLTVQPLNTINRLKGFFRRFAKQVNSLRIGSIHDIQRRMSYVTDYELVLTSDLCETLSVLKNLYSLCIRNCLITCKVLDEWSSDESAFMRQIQSFCFHGIWFDKPADSDRFMSILKCEVRRLHLSKCGTEILCQIADRLSFLGVNLDYIYLLLNVHSVNKEYYIRESLKRLSRVCDELRLCISLSTMNAGEEQFLLIRTLRFISEYPKITVLELDVGFPDIRVAHRLQKFFRAYNVLFDFINVFLNPVLLELHDLPHLRTLRFSCATLEKYQFPVWQGLFSGLLSLHTVTELAIRGICGKLTSSYIQRLCESLPGSLKRCRKLEVLLIIGAKDIQCEAVCYSLKKLRNLQCIALSSIATMSDDLVRLLCCKSETPSLEALSFGQLKMSFNSSTLGCLSRRFHHVKVTHSFCCDERLNEGIQTTHLYQSQRGFQRILDGLSFGECPGCEKDLTLFEDDS